jgi:hypothetical protein
MGGERGKLTASVPSRLEGVGESWRDKMGMDVYGVAPVADNGKYFRASIWMWRPIWERMAVLCHDVLSKELLSAMGYNNGAGPEDQETCNLIAQRLEEWLAQEGSDEFSLVEDTTTLRVTSEGRFVSDQELSADPTLKTKSPYSVSREELKEFIEFLRSCGGFCVW